MLPLGATGLGRHTHFTKDEQYTLMTLWSIFRSPLIYGGDLTLMDDFTLSLLTNKEVLAVDQDSSNGHQIFNRDGFIGWVADIPHSKDRYLSLFNTRNTDTNAPSVSVLVPVSFAEAGFTGRCKVRDLWQQKNLGKFKGSFAPQIPWHGAGLYRISGKRVLQKSVAH
jgi:hypothetical protein